MSAEKAEKIAAMTPEDFKTWMDENAFTPDSLAAALHVHTTSVFRWKSGAHPIDYITWLALRCLAADRPALRERQRALRALEHERDVRDQQAGRVRNAREHVRTAGATSA